MSPQMEQGRGWWGHPALLAALVVAAAAPLLWPAVPPLIDLPGHMARLHVAQAIDSSPFLSRWYAFRWALVGNLGVDLLSIPLARAIGLEPAVKAIMIAIPALTAAAMLWLAREVHGRVPPTAAFALPLALGFPFMFGFANYVLGVMLMFAALALWVRLGRLGRSRFGWFVPIGFVVFIAHSIAWGMLGIAAFAFEWISRRREGGSVAGATMGTAIVVVPLAFPALLLFGWFGGHLDAPSTEWATPSAKYYYAMAILRNDDATIDLMSARLLYALVILGVGGLGLKLDARLFAAGLALFAAFLAIPATALSAAYTDMRIAPYAVALALLALRPTAERPFWSNLIAVGAIAFALARFAIDTATLLRLDRIWTAQLAALDHLPRGARVFVLANVPCADEWRQSRVDNLGGMATVRRDAFANGQWPMAGGRLLSVIYEPARGFALDPTQFLHPDRCRARENYSLPDALRLLPRPAFDYLWLIDVPPDTWPTAPWLAPVWHGRTGILYRIAH